MSGSTRYPKGTSDPPYTQLGTPLLALKLAPPSHHSPSVQVSTLSRPRQHPRSPSPCVQHTQQLLRTSFVDVLVILRPPRSPPRQCSSSRPICAAASLLFSLLLFFSPLKRDFPSPAPTCTCGAPVTVLKQKMQITLRSFGGPTSCRLTCRL